LIKKEMEKLERELFKKPVHIRKNYHELIKIKAVKEDSTIEKEVDKILKKEFGIEDV